MIEERFETNTTIVVAADPSPIVLHGFEALIRTMDGFSLLASCLLPETVTGSVLAKQARIVILGAGMPAIPVLTQIRSARSNCAAMVISNGLERAEILHAKLLGASAILPPTSSVDTIRAGLLRMRHYPLEPQVRATRVRQAAGVLPRLPGLSVRQVQIAHLVASGLSNSQISMALGISPRTVKVHVYDIFSRLGLQSRIQLAVYVERSQSSGALGRGSGRPSEKLGTDG